MALGYKQLIEVEDAFRTLKHTLDLRPLYHRVEERMHLGEFVGPEGAVW